MDILENTNKIKNKDLLKYLFLGVLFWLIIDSIAHIVKEVATFFIVQVKMSVFLQLTSIHFLILLSVFFGSWFVTIYILRNKYNFKFFIIRLSIFFILVTVIKIAAYSLNPILTTFDSSIVGPYFYEISSNKYYLSFQVFNGYLKIALVLFTLILIRNKLKNEIN